MENSSLTGVPQLVQNKESEYNLVPQFWQNISTIAMLSDLAIVSSLVSLSSVTEYSIECSILSSCVSDDFFILGIGFIGVSTLSIFLKRK